MKICIHRGTKEIGGTCIEVEKEGKRIVLDVGLPLDADQSDDPEDLLPKVSGFREKDDSLLAVIISHPHQDHFGLTKYLRPDLPICIGQAANRILQTASIYSPIKASFKNTIFLKDRESFKLGSFQITPYLVDHSAFDAYSLLIEGNGKRLFYSGDFRGHGRKSKLFEKLLSDPPKNIDVLLMEGTNIGRESKIEPVTEEDLVWEFEQIFMKNTGLRLIWTSGQNIDRLVTIYKACKKAKRILIMDLYTAEILRATESQNIPQGTWDDVRIFIPEYHRRDIKRKGVFDIINRYRQNRIFPENLKETAPNSVLIFRPKMAGDLEAANCLKESCLVYSLWDGYLKMSGQRPFREWLERNQIPLYKLHTSGHASINDLKRFAKAVDSKSLVPIHSFHPENFKEVYDKVEWKTDCDWWEV